MPDSAPGMEAIEVIYTAESIADRIAVLAEGIAALKLDRLLVVPILTGSFVFAGDLLRGLHWAGLAPEVDFLSVSSYRDGTKSVGKVDILRDLKLDVAGRNVLVIDDILDTGRTLAFAKDLIAARGAAQVVTCVLLDKKTRRAVAIEADYVAFECPPVFVVGYGMDLASRFRELPFVGRIVG
ncbi:MAG: hypoxanthine phosphoribosyltransferase [Hyphomicrobium sp.]|nr:hypoxanthine phosphoribosyltransferase [Hyphomicrobium sp.]